ncbi:MAG TPA: alpha/beta hydrolase [Gaiellaceae bacterium]|nr:alpha/beta hydrolase [Gaiellaceae bacterium]
MEIVTPHPTHRRYTATRILASVRTESGLLVLGAGLVALHVLDDNFVQPNPGMSAGDHLAGGLVPLALLMGAVVLYGRVRAGARATMALLLGFFGVLAGTEAVYYTRAVGPSGDDYTGMLSLLAGLVLLGVGAATLWTSRRRDDRLPWRYGRRFLMTIAAALAAVAVLFPLAIGYVVSHVARAEVPQPDLGAAYENVEFRTSDGLTLKGWYIPSKNGAAVISFPGRSGTRKPAKMLARHGYGVLLFDRRGEGESHGDPNGFGWQGERDVHAAVTFLQGRADVDPERIGGIGLSVGGEMMIEAAAESTALKAIVSEGGSGRSVRDIVANPGGSWQDIFGNALATASTAVFTSNMPPADLRSLVPKIAPRAVFFIYGERGQSVEEPANRAFYEDAGQPKAIWEVPDAGHVGGINAQPVEYERRVVGFFDNALLDTK